MGPIIKSGEQPDPDESGSDVLIHIAIPEEFAGAAQEQIYRHDGVITSMESEGHTFKMDAALPARAFELFVNAVRNVSQGRGKVERR
jgi:translation elongation factor EF-G